MSLLQTLQMFFQPWLTFLSQDPLLRMLQIGMLLGGVIAVFLVFYTTRDILLRTNSFLYMFICILLVAFLPVVGFFLYLLVRPARTIKERELEDVVRSFMQKEEKKSKVPKKKAVPGSAEKKQQKEEIEE